VLILSILLLTGQSCTKEITVKQEINMDLVDQYILGVADVQLQIGSTISARKQKNRSLLEQIEIAVENEDGDAIFALYNSLGVTKDALDNVEDQIKELLSEFGGNEDQAKAVLQTRMQELIDDGTIGVEVLISGAKHGCSAADAGEVVISGALATVGGCSAGPIGCIAGFGFALFKIGRFAIECGTT